MYNTEKFDLMTLDEKHEYFMKTTDEIRRNGVFKKWYQLAEILECSPNAISGAKNKNADYLTSNLLLKIEHLRDKAGLAATQPVQNSPAVPVPAPVRVSAPLTFVDNVRPVEMKYVPTIPIKAYRAVDFDVMEYFRTTDDVIHLTPIITQFPGTDCYYFVNSDDMSPNLRTNDLLCLSRLPSPEHITNGDLCILNTRRQGMLERFVYDDGDALVLRSTQPRWTDMRIPKDDIFSIFRILGGIRTNI